MPTPARPVTTVALGCLAHLALLAIVAIGVDRQVHAHLPPDLRLAIVAAASLLLTVGVSNLWTLARGYGQGDRSRATLRARARTGEPPPQDGPFVATGTARPEGAALRAPISGIECVAYQYRLYTSQWLPGSRHRELPVYWGYACRPFRIDAAGRSSRVLASPRLADAAAQHASGDARDRAKAYIAATRFEQQQALAGMASAATALFGELMRESSGDVRRDWQAAHIAVDVDTLLMEEIAVPVGATVSVSGCWSVERRAIVPGDPADGTLGVTLVTGPAERLTEDGASELPFSASSVLITAALSLLAGTALVWLSATGRIAAWWRVP